MSGRLFSGCTPLVTMAGPERPRRGREMRDIGVVPSGAILVDEGRVVAAGPLNMVQTIADDPQVVDLGGRLVTPGLVDAHTHAAFVGQRADEFYRRVAGESHAQIADSGGGIRVSVRHVREADDQTLRKSIAIHLEWMLRAGTTSAEVKSGYGMSSEHELRLLRALREVAVEGGVRVTPTLLAMHGVPNEHEGGKTAFVDEVVENLVPKVAGQGLAEYCDAFVDSAHYGAEDVKRLARAAMENGLSLRLHVDQMADEGGAALASRLGAATADHLEHTGPAGIRALAESTTFPLLLPASVIGLGHAKYPDATAMLDAGLPVVLATDFNPGSAPCWSLPLVMRLACQFMGMDPNEAWTACTINAAHSIGKENEVGSLEAGKFADFCVWPARDPREIPYWMGAAPDEVYVSGSRVC